MNEFKNFGELINLINTTLGNFCNEFGLKRKELARLGRCPTRGILFTYDVSTNRDWAINEGGGTEIQYHITFDVDALEIRYGLGFNTQHVPYYNDPGIDYMKPFMNGFLRNETKIKELLPDYDFMYGDIELLKKPENNKYVSFGKSKEVKEKEDGYFIEDVVFNEIINDLKKQLKAYEIIFEAKNNSTKVAMNVQNSLNVLLEKGQIILQGPPGAGKTYTAKDLAEQIIFSEVSSDKNDQKQRLESSEQFKLIQFHPSYSYEDFVRGIVAKSKGDFIEYVTENKVLAKFVNGANINYLNSKKTVSEYSEEKWVSDHLSLFCNEVQEKLDKKGAFPLTDNVSIIELDEDAFRYTGKEWGNANGNRMLFRAC